MEITAVREAPGKPYALTLTGAPQGTVVEVRTTNTMNGIGSVHTGEVKNGAVVLPVPNDFGQHIHFEARVLTADKADKVVRFHYDKDATTRDGNTLKLIESVEPESEPEARSAASESTTESNF